MDLSLVDENPRSRQWDRDRVAGPTTVLALATAAQPDSHLGRQTHARSAGTGVQERIMIDTMVSVCNKSKWYWLVVGPRNTRSRYNPQDAIPLKINAATPYWPLLFLVRLKSGSNGKRHMQKLRIEHIDYSWEESRKICSK